MKFKILIFILLSAVLHSQERVIDSVNIFTTAKKTDAVTFNNIVLKDDKISDPSTTISIHTSNATSYSDNGSPLGYSYYRIRGIDQTRINVLFDGAPLNEPEDQGAYFSNYPDLFGALNMIQVQKGIGLSKNGTASYGGSIQLFSPYIKEDNTEVGVSYGSYNTSRAYVSHSSLNDNKSIIIRLSEQYTDGYKYDSKNHGQSLFLSGQIVNPKSTWRFNSISGNQTNLQAWLPVSEVEIEKDRRTNGNNNEKDNFFQTFNQLWNSTNLTNNIELQSSIYYTYLKGNYDFDLNNFLSIPEQGEIYNYAFESNFVGFYSTLKKDLGNFKLSTGINGSLYNRSHTGSEVTYGKLYHNNGFKNEFATFIQLSYRLNNLKIYGDLQYRTTKFTYKGDKDFEIPSWNFVNPKIGLSYSIKNHEIYSSLGNVGREPTRTDIFGGEDNYGMTYITKPEYVTDVEMGYRFNNSKLNTSVNLFWMNFTDEMVLTGVYGNNALSLTQSVDKSVRKGIEGIISYKMDSWNFGGNFAWSNSEIENEGRKYNHILTPNFILNLNAVKYFNKFKIGLDTRYQSESWMDFDNTSELPSFLLINSNLEYSFDKFDIGIRLNNLTNRKYYTNGILEDGVRKYFVQMPINYNINFKYKF